MNAVNLSAISAPVQGRYEIKLVCPGVYVPQVRTLVRLHPEGFRVTYPARWVNSVYFDSFDIEGVLDNLDGVSERDKLRWRWYGPDWLIERSHLELKRKRGMAGFKALCPIGEPFDPRLATWTEALAFLRRHADDGFRVWLSQVSCATIITRYEREYYASPDGGIRLTLDMQLSTFDQRFSCRPNLRHPSPPPGTLLIELKAEAALADRLSDVLNALPFRPERNSKYVNGFLVTAEALGGLVFA
jgi:VTC domain